MQKAVEESALFRGLGFPCRLIDAARHIDSIRDVNGRAAETMRPASWLEVSEAGPRPMIYFVSIRCVDSLLP
jgi:hypothetical protein